MTLYLYGDSVTKFRFMLHAVDDLGNRVMAAETCSRLWLSPPEGTLLVSYFTTTPDHKLTQQSINQSTQKITLTSQTEARMQDCQPPTICVRSNNIVGIEGLLPGRPSRISFSTWAAYFAVFEELAPQSYGQPRSLTVFDVGLNQAYELAGPTTPQPNAFWLAYGADELDSWYRFEPKNMPYVHDQFVSLLFAYQSRLHAAIRDSLLFLLAAVLGVAFQAVVDAARRKKRPNEKSEDEQ